MKRIVLLTACVLLAGCASRGYVPSGYSLSAYSGSAFSVPGSVWVYNATPSKVEKLGSFLHSDLRDWGRQLTYGLEHSLKNRGAKIDRTARKKIGIQVTHAEVKNKILKYTAHMECVVSLGNGHAERITAFHSAQVDREACSGLMPVVIDRILSSPSVVRYLSSV
jgi:hypothetical protein